MNKRFFYRLYSQTHSFLSSEVFTQKQTQKSFNVFISKRVTGRTSIRPLHILPETQQETNKKTFFRLQSDKNSFREITQRKGARSVSEIHVHTNKNQTNKYKDFQNKSPGCLRILKKIKRHLTKTCMKTQRTQRQQIRNVTNITKPAFKIKL